MQAICFNRVLALSVSILCKFECIFNRLYNADNGCYLRHNVNPQNSVDLVRNMILMYSKIHNRSIFTSALR